MHSTDAARQKMTQKTAHGEQPEESDGPDGPPARAEEDEKEAEDEEDEKMSTATWPRRGWQEDGKPRRGCRAGRKHRKHRAEDSWSNKDRRWKNPGYDLSWEEEAEEEWELNPPWSGPKHVGQKTNWPNEHIPTGGTGGSSSSSAQNRKSSPKLAPGAGKTRLIERHDKMRWMS